MVWIIIEGAKANSNGGERKSAGSAFTKRIRRLFKLFRQRWRMLWS